MSKDDRGRAGSSSRRKFLLTGGAVTLTGLAGCSGGSGEGGDAGAGLDSGERGVRVTGDLRRSLETYGYDEEFQAACEEIGVDPADPKRDVTVTGAVGSTTAESRTDVSAAGRDPDGDRVVDGDGAATGSAGETR